MRLNNIARDSTLGRFSWRLTRNLAHEGPPLARNRRGSHTMGCEHQDSVGMDHSDPRLA
jgi:hypothetical protein